jgi:hypothetical protein
MRNFITREAAAMHERLQMAKALGIDVSRIKKVHVSGKTRLGVIDGCKR